MWAQDMNYMILGLLSSLLEKSAPKRRWQIEINYFKRLPQARLRSAVFSEKSFTRVLMMMPWLFELMTGSRVWLLMLR